MKTAALEFERLLAESAIFHGHLCPGQVLGVKMSMLGFSEIGGGREKGDCR
jgi:formylmethanofuran dehydrogenase subunit E